MVALIRARYPSYTPAQVVSRLIATVDDLGYPGYDNRYGDGRVNAFRARRRQRGAPAAVERVTRWSRINSLGTAPRHPARHRDAPVALSGR